MSRSRTTRFVAFTALMALLSSAPRLAVATTCGLLGQHLGPIYLNDNYRPRVVSYTDMNMDGVPDLVTAFPDGSLGSPVNFIGVRLGLATAGHSNGSFGVNQFTVTGSRPLGMVVADFDGDNVPDVVTANWGANTISFLHNTGNGVFNPHVDFPAGSNPYGIVAGDFNHDGALDLAVADNGLARVSILLGNLASGHGDGTFQVPVSYSILDKSTAIVAVDLDNDGNLDLVATSNLSGRVSVLMGKADGTFTRGADFVAGPEPYGLVAADFNGDGRKDVAVSSSNSGGVIVLLGLGNGTFQGGVSYVSGVSGGDILAADVDGDGVRDLVLTNSTGNQVVVLPGMGSSGVGDGTFGAAVTTPVSNFPVGVTLADIDADGISDLVVSSYLSQQLAVIRGGCEAVLGTPHLTSVRDVPNDQGSKVFVTWTGSSLDTPGGAVTGYRVWRRIPPAAANAASTRLALGDSDVRATRPDASSDIVYWEAAASLPAQRLAGYGYTAATPQDSMAIGNPYTAFFITATTANPDIFYDSPVDSGYSVDNLAPIPPAAFTGQYLSGQVVLHWLPSPDADLAGYRLYRGTDIAFVPGDANLIQATNATSFTDVTPTPYYYKLTAVDVHGNVSTERLVAPGSATAAEVSLVSGEYVDGAARLDWYVDSHVVPVADVQRFDGGNWATIGSGSPDGAGHLVFADVTLHPGASAQYRLQWMTAGVANHGGEVSVSAPALRLAFHGAQPNPASAREGALAFTLARNAPATLAVFDMAGRRLVSRDVGAMGAGLRRIALADLRLPAGIYLARLSQGSEVSSGRFILMP